MSENYYLGSFEDMRMSTSSEKVKFTLRGLKYNKNLN